MTEDELIAIVLHNAAPPPSYPELYPQPEFDATTGLTINAPWSVTGGEAVNSGSAANLDGLLNEAIVPGASYQLIVAYTGFADDVVGQLIGVSTQNLGVVISGASPVTTNFVASASANTSLRLVNLGDGAGALQSVSLKRTA